MLSKPTAFPSTPIFLWNISRRVKLAATREEIKIHVPRRATMRRSRSFRKFLRSLKQLLTRGTGILSAANKTIHYPAVRARGGKSVDSWPLLGVYEGEKAGRGEVREKATIPGGLKEQWIAFMKVYIEFGVDWWVYPPSRLHRRTGTFDSHFTGC